MMTGLVDAHNHLQEEVLQPHLPEVLRRAREAGVTVQVVNGTHPGDWPEVLELSRAHTDIIPCFGLHPWFVTDTAVVTEEWPRQLRDCLTAAPSAVGEIGLDRWVRDRDEAAQERAFVLQLEIARKLDRPIMIHCLKAWGWMLEVLEREGPPPAGMLIHAFGGAAELVPQLQRLGAYFSFGASVLDERHAKARQALQAVPLSRLLIETDAPALAPSTQTTDLEDTPIYIVHGESGERYNEPANLPLVLEGVARLRGLSVEELRDITWQNARGLLGDLIPRTGGALE